MPASDGRGSAWRSIAGSGSSATSARTFGGVCLKPSPVPAPTSRTRPEACESRACRRRSISPCSARRARTPYQSANAGRLRRSRRLPRAAMAVVTTAPFTNTARFLLRTSPSWRTCRGAGAPAGSHGPLRRRVLRGVAVRRGRGLPSSPNELGFSLRQTVPRWLGCPVRFQLKYLTPIKRRRSSRTTSECCMSAMATACTGGRAVIHSARQPSCCTVATVRRRLQQLRNSPPGFGLPTEPLGRAPLATTKGEAHMHVRRFVNTALAVAALVSGVARPSHGSLLVPVGN